MSHPTDGQSAEPIREIHGALDTIERCVRQIAVDPVQSELIDLVLQLRNRVSLVLAETGSTHEEDR